MQLHRDREKFEGADLYLVGMGTPAHAKHFAEETGVEFPILLSKDKSAYRAMDLKRGSLREVFDPRAMLLGRKRKEAFVARQPEQDWHQLGGAFVIAPGGKVVWAHRAKHSGDNPDHDELVDALRRAAA